MPVGKVSILSGTRSELGGVDVGLANVFERPERPGVLTCLLVLPDRQHVLGVGDEIEVGTTMFRLTAFEPHRTGTHSAVFEPIVTPIPVRRQGMPDGLHSLALAKALREATPQLLAALGGAHVGACQWVQTRTSTMHKEWNGAEFGPTVTTNWVAELDLSDGAPRTEASVTLEDIRYSPEEPWRTDTSGFWRVGEQTASMLARADVGKERAEYVVQNVPEAVRMVLEKLLAVD